MDKEKILKILGEKCASCGSKKILHIHHKLPHWLWRYVGETDKGVLSTKHLTNYEVLCQECHRKRHSFLNKNVAQVFRSRYTVKIRWKRYTDRGNVINGTYEIGIDDEGWRSMSLVSLG